MTLAAIVAVSSNGVIGHDNQIPWYLPADLAYFKRMTLGKPVIMGRKCFRSIGRALPKRLNVVLSLDPFFRADGIEIAHSPAEAFDIAAATGAELAFVIGGAQIYEAFWEKTEILYYTEVHIKVEGDVFFPAVSPEEWELQSSEHHAADEKNECAYTFKVFRRRVN